MVEGAGANDQETPRKLDATSAPNVIRTSPADHALPAMRLLGSTQTRCLAEKFSRVLRLAHGGILKNIPTAAPTAWNASWSEILYIS
jgi:hypothetical protein